jgi:hypothetical protein
MPGVSTEMKKSLGTTLTNLNKVTIPKLDTAAKKIDDLTGTASVDAANLTKLKATLKTLGERQENLDVGGLDDKRYQTLRADINKAQTEATKMLGRLQREYTAAGANAWKAAVRKPNGQQVDLGDYDSTLQGVLKKIVQAKGGGHHGNVTMANGTTCLHWVSGAIRIFGRYNNNQLTLIGTGRHSGKGNANYKVDLVAGGSTTAQTS